MEGTEYDRRPGEGLASLCHVGCLPLADALRTRACDVAEGAAFSREGGLEAWWSGDGEGGRKSEHRHLKVGE